MKKIPDYVKGADNIYRTKNFIVKQELMQSKSGGYSVTDTYYPRTAERDSEFRQFAGTNANRDGLRITTGGDEPMPRKVIFKKR